MAASDYITTTKIAHALPIYCITPMLFHCSNRTMNN